MKLMTGIDDCPMSDDDDDAERKRPKDGYPTPWKHCRTRHVSKSWNRPRNLGGTTRPLAIWMTDVWESPVDCRSRVFAYGPHSSTYGGPTRESWAVAETTDFGSEDPELVAFVLVRLALDDPSLLERLEGN